MFIIWGWRGVPETIGEGDFFCPTCRCNTLYDHQQMRTYLTIFFLPVIPLAAGERCVRCRQCQMTFLEAVLTLSAPQRNGSGFDSGDRVLGKRGEYWYPGMVRSMAGKKIKVDFDDGKHDILSKSHVIPLDLQAGDPVFVRQPTSGDYQFGNITARNGDGLEVRLEDGRQEWTKLAQVRVIWEDEGAK